MDSILTQEADTLKVRIASFYIYIHIIITLYGEIPPETLIQILFKIEESSRLKYYCIYIYIL